MTSNLQTGPPRPFATRLARHPWEAHYPPGMDWRAPIPTGLLTDMLQDSVKRHGEHPCMDFMGKRWRYADLGVAVKRLARGLQDLGVGPGIKVGLLMPNCPMLIVSFYAVLRAGGTVVTYNPLYATEEIARQITDSGTVVMITLDLEALYGKVAPMLERTGLERVVVCSMADQLPFPEKALFTLFQRGAIARYAADARHVPVAHAMERDVPPDPVTWEAREDAAVLQYTGGTTGIPKAAVLTHAGLYANTLQMAQYAKAAGLKRERILAVLPLSHAFALTAIMNVGIHTGSEIVLLPRFRLPELLKTIEQRRPTLFLGVPTLFAAIANAPELGRRDLSSLKVAVSGGAPMPLRIKQAFEARTRCQIVEGYGLTEASPVVCCTPFHGPNRPGSVGPPLPGTEVQIVSTDRARRVLPTGETGEIRVRGPQVMRGYYNHPEETAKVMEDGALLTGDVGYLDDMGWLHVIDRIKEMIITGGYNVYPSLVEEAILRHPSVREVAVIAAPHARLGQIPKAVVVLRRGERLTLRELRRFLEDKLASFEMPRLMEISDSLPRTAMGKPDKAALAGTRSPARTQALKEQDKEEERP